MIAYIELGYLGTKKQYLHHPQALDFGCSPVHFPERPLKSIVVERSLPQPAVLGLCFAIYVNKCCIGRKNGDLSRAQISSNLRLSLEAIEIKKIEELASACC